MVTNYNVCHQLENTGMSGKYCVTEKEIIHCRPLMEWTVVD